jgi:hypothetical protein
MRRREPEAAAEPLLCVSCAATAPPSERFCPRCGTPLVHGPGADVPPPLGEAGERARKIKPQYGEGRLMRVATARHQAEAELLQGMLLEEGIPSMTRRTRGFDVPDFLAAGPRDVLVPASGEAAARDVLGLPPDAEAAVPAAASGRAAWTRALAVALAVLVVAMVAAGVLAAVFG